MRGMSVMLLLLSHTKAEKDSEIHQMHLKTNKTLKREKKD